ncbi:MAG: D-alanyl-D-alanine carboxypeptidase family protein [Eubacteriales bacterium]|jgi:D-alanyl-D-alanine carboxypeptidase (penicillin-binding protein 5/6)
MRATNRAVAWLLSCVLLLCSWSGCLVMAAGEQESVETSVSQSQEPVQEVTPQQMEQAVAGQSMQVLSSRDIVSSGFYLVDSVTGTVLAEKNIHEQRPVAGLAKMVTALVVLEKGNINETITISEEAGTRFGRDNRVVDLKPGEEMQVQDLLYCMLLAPSNEAAYALAEYVGDGSVPQFVEMMNQLAAAAGCQETHFTNPNGTDEEGQYSTPYDMYLLGRYAMANPRYMEICSAVHKQVPATNLTDARYFLTDNRLISPSKEDTYYYSAARGMASGYTNGAGYCLVTSAQRSNMQLICVVMGGKVYGEEELISSYVDAKNAMVKTFETLQSYSVAKAGDMVKEVAVAAGAMDHVSLGPQQDVRMLLPADAEAEDVTVEYTLPDLIKAPVKTGDVVGTMKVLYQGVECGSYALSALMDVRQSFFGAIGYYLGLFFRNIVVRILLVLFVLFLIFYIRLTIVVNHKRQQQLKDNHMRKSRKRY